MSGLYAAERPTLLDFLRSAPNSAATLATGGPHGPNGAQSTRLPKVEGFIILDYIPTIEELGEVIRRHQPIRSARLAAPGQGPY